MPTLAGSMDIFGDRPEQPCRWCGAPTATLLAPPDSRAGPVPLHAVCGAEVIEAYHDLRAGRTPSAAMLANLRRLEAGS
jgi:hypothetical protein